MAKKKDTSLASRMGLKGSFRLNVVNQDGSIASDSGWIENQITNLGVELYVIRTLASLAGSLQIGWVALGVGAAPASDATTLPTGEVEKRAAVTAATLGSKTVQFTATFASTLSFVTGAGTTITSIGLFGYSSKGSGQIFAGQSYTGTAVATNQAVNVTYQISAAN